MTSRILYGNIGDGRYGLRVAKIGGDVITPAPGDLIFDTVDTLGTIRTIQLGVAVIAPSTTSVSVPISGIGGGKAFALVWHASVDGYYFTLGLDAYVTSCSLTTSALSIVVPSTSGSPRNFPYQIIGY